jgi:penicillin V acylase-like amidase (Ntn superfamily)
MVALAVLAAAPLGCSDFYMPINGTKFRLSVRTMDLGLDGGWNITSQPRGVQQTQSVAPPVGKALAWSTVYGSLGFSAPKYGFPVDNAVGEAINEKGLSCGALALTPSKMTLPSPTKPNLHMKYLCAWSVDQFETVAQVRSALTNDVQLYGHGMPARPGDVGADYTHWVFRDATGQSLVVEAPGDGPAPGTLHMHDDPNDGKTGFGIMTNEPAFEYHLANAKHLQWKRTLVRQAVPVPGSWYPEERFMRVLMVKEAMPPPPDVQTAVAQAVGVLNTITVPMGAPPGTDSGPRSAEMGDFDHTVFGVVRDHANPAVYWRSAYNPSLQRLRLSDVDLAEGAQPKSLRVSSGPWFADAALATR